MSRQALLTALKNIYAICDLGERKLTLPWILSPDTGSRSFAVLARSYAPCSWEVLFFACTESLFYHTGARPLERGGLGLIRSLIAEARRLEK